MIFNTILRLQHHLLTAVTGRHIIFRWSHSHTSRIHMGGRPISLAQCASHCILGRRWPHTGGFWGVRNIHATQTATPPCPTLQDPEYSRLYSCWLDDANGLARPECILANPDYCSFYNESSCYRPNVLYHRYCRSRGGARFRTSIPKCGPSQMANGDRRLNDCCILHGHGRGDV